MGVPSLLVSGALAALGVALPAPAAAQYPNGTTVDQTPHNLSRPASNPHPDMVGRIRDYGEVCVYCHTPHGGPNWSGAPRTPLWNRLRPTPGYRMPQHAGQNMVQDPSPSDRARVCLSCHDGSRGLDAVQNQPATYTGPPPANRFIDECEGCHKGNNPDGGLDFEGVWFDPDMRDQHPISVLYDPARRPGQFKAAIGGAVNGLPLYAGKVECQTCHEPHSQRFRFFLRQTNLGNALCLQCHNSVPADPVHQ